MHAVKKTKAKSKAIKVKKAAHKKNLIKPHKSEEPASFVLFQPDLLKRDLVRQTIITVLWRKEEVTPAVLLTELRKEIGHHFDGDIEQYTRKMMSDLITWKLMEETPGKKPLHYRLAQRLDKEDEE